LIIVAIAFGVALASGSPASARSDAAALNLSGAMISDASCYADSIGPVSGFGGPYSTRLNLPFWVVFGGSAFNRFRVTNQGYLTFRNIDQYGFDPDWDFGSQQSWTQSRFNIAPLWSSGYMKTASGGPTTFYGTTTYEGHAAFCASWVDEVTGHLCASDFTPDFSKTNSYQVLIVDRSDTGHEDFDIVLNYGSIQWDHYSGGCTSGQVGAGYSLSTPGSGQMLSGSWTTGSLLDSNQTSGLIHNSQGSTQLGRYVFPIRNGLATPVVPPGGTLGGAGSDGSLGANPSGSQSEPVNTATGSYYTSVTDLSLPGIGVPFAMKRSYNSADPTSGPLGPGWTHALVASLAIQPNGDVLAKGGDGQEVYFTKSGATFTAPGFARASLSTVSGGYELVTNDQLHYRFDSQGHLTSKKDRNGQGLTLTNNPDGTVASVTDSGNRLITFAYSAGLLTQVILQDGRHVSYGYVGGRLDTVTDVLGGTTHYTYDASGKLQTIIDQNGHQVVKNAYSAVTGRITDQWDAFNHHSTFQWDAASATSTYTDARGNPWKDVYKNNLLVQRIDPLGNTTRYNYDSAANLTDVIKPLGYTPITMTYDARGNLLSRSFPPRSFTYTALNDVQTATDGRGNTTTYGYDTAGNLRTITGPALPSFGQPVTTYGRDPAGTGLLTSITDPRGKQTTFGHDAQGNATSVTTQLGETTLLCYDGSGRLIARVDPRGSVPCANPSPYRSTFTYYDDDRLHTATDPLNHQTQYAYDPAGNPQTVVDAKNHTTTYGYDDANHLTSVTAPDPITGGPSGPVTSYGYDEVGNLQSRTDANTHQTTYSYDIANELKTVVAPGGRTWTYSYDANGNRTTIVDANGNATPDPNDGTTTFGYDVLDQLTSVGYSGGGASFVYDGNQNLTRMTDATGPETYGYDLLNRLTSVTRSSAFIYSYDKVNLIQKTYPDSTSVTYTYDDDERLQTVASGGQTTSYSYDLAGNLKTTTLPSGNGYVETRTYDNAGRLTGVKNQKGTGTPVSDFVSTLDPVGNPTQIIRTGSALTQTQTFSYDGMDRLAGVCFQSGNCPGGSDPFVRWTYDGVGNRLTEQRPSGVTNYTYNVADELTQAGAAAYTYDQNGNELSSGPRTFTYDGANQLTATTGGGTTTTYTYDGIGKRLQASTGTQASKKTNYLWDISGPLAQIALERDGNNGLLRRYVNGQAPISMTSGNSTSYFHADPLGSVTNMTSSSGTTQWTYAYEPFGVTKTETKNNSQAPTNFTKFTGQYFDPTGLYHLRARQYDPASGRFLTRDPLAAPVEPAVSSYQYANARPTVLRDPSGMRWCGPACGVFDPVVGSIESGTRTAVGAGVIVVGAAFVVAGPVVAVACTAVTEGIGVVHCIGAGTFVSVAGLGAIYVGVGVLGKSSK